MDQTVVWKRVLHGGIFQACFIQWVLVARIQSKASILCGDKYVFASYYDLSLLEFWNVTAPVQIL